MQAMQEVRRKRYLSTFGWSIKIVFSDGKEEKGERGEGWKEKNGKLDCPISYILVLLPVRITNFTNLMLFAIKEKHEAPVHRSVFYFLSTFGKRVFHNVVYLYIFHRHFLRQPAAI